MATLHRLGHTVPTEHELCQYAESRPLALVLPCHAEELGSPALERMVDVLRDTPYLTRIFIGLDGADETAWRQARRLFARLPQSPLVLWNDGPRIQALIARLDSVDLAPGGSGKGRNLWLCFGCVIADGRAKVVAAHDCDILTYDRELLSRLCLPVLHPHLGFDFSKGFSARFTDRLHGRAMRLLFTPLVRSLQSIVGPQPFLDYLDSLRYPLSGEMAMDLDILRRARIPADWGVETGILAEVFRLVSPKAMCQVDVAECYEHKHRELSPDDPARGLNKMAHDITKRIFLTLAAQGVKLDRGIFDTLLTAYVRKAEDLMRFYAADSIINGLHYHRHEEELAVSTFARAIQTAGLDHLANPLSDPMIPEWNRVETTLPGFQHDLLAAAHADKA